MDLKEFIKIHIKKNTIGNIVEGVGQSSFADSDVDVYELVKNMLNKMLAENKPYYHLQSGGLISTALKKSELEKKQSYCTDFNLLINNILVLLGYEFTKYLMFLSTLKHHIRKILLLLGQSMDYEDIAKHIKCIENLYKLKNVLTVEKEFNYKKYLTINSTTRNPLDFNINDDIDKDIVGEIFDNLNHHLDVVIKNNSLVTFDKDKRNWIQMFSEMLLFTKYTNYKVNTIDEFCLNLGIYDIGYEGSFLKLFDILYRENYADIPREYVEPIIFTKVLPHMDYLKSLEIGSCDNFPTDIRKYFEKMYINTYRTLNYVPEDVEVSPVEISNHFYDYLSHVSLNLFVQLTKNIAQNQQIQTCFGKSTRIQFVQILTALHGCLPKFCSFTNSQNDTLHYFLLGKKTLQESYNIAIKK